jgi:hypothetical protein
VKQYLLYLSLFFSFWLIATPVNADWFVNGNGNLENENGTIQVCGEGGCNARKANRDQKKLDRKKRRKARKAARKRRKSAKDSGNGVQGGNGACDDSDLGCLNWK